MRAPLAALAGALVVAAGAAGALLLTADQQDTDLAASQDLARAGAAEHPEMTLPAVPSAGLPFAVDIQAKFDLIDETGAPVTEASFAGKPMAIFFGYANCEAICSVALPRLGQALDLMGEDRAGLAPLVITVDPENDTVDRIGPALDKWHPDLIGLTGSADALAEARAAFQVQAKKEFDDPEGNPVYSHGGFVYLIGADGQVLTIMPPILGPERMAEVMRSYL